MITDIYRRQRRNLSADAAAAFTAAAAGPA